MKVKELIAELKKMPQDLEVHISSCNSLPWDTKGKLHSVKMNSKVVCDQHVENCNDVHSKYMYSYMPDRWITLYR